MDGSVVLVVFDEGVGEEFEVQGFGGGGLPLLE